MLTTLKHLWRATGSTPHGRRRPASGMPTRRRRERGFRLHLEGLEGRLVLSTLLTTDQLDYTPGSTVVFNGSGFAPNETVDLSIVSTTSGTTPLQVVDDSNGNFTVDWNVGDDNIGATLVATATGETSGASATATFTDSNSFTTCLSDGTAEPSNYQFLTRQDVYIEALGSPHAPAAGNYYVEVTDAGTATVLGNRAYAPEFSGIWANTLNK